MRDDFLDIKECIKRQAENIGIDVIGFTSCDPFDEIKDILIERERMGYLSGFEEKDVEKRVNPGLLLDNCCTIISSGISYYTDINDLKPENKSSLKYTVSRSSWGQDYHNVLKGMLLKLGEFIKHEYNAEYRIFVDTGPLPERAVAKRAGVGFLGKNGFIINPQFGSFIFLGELLTTLCIEPDIPIDDSCGECDLCIKSCPSCALIKPCTLNAKECISYLTQSKKINPKNYSILGRNIYGCDICQMVCPKNRSAISGRHVEFIPKDWNFCPNPVNILNMNNKTYNDTFKRTSSGWRGKKLLQRNMIIAMGNSGDKSSAQYIANMLSDCRPEIREASIYALYKLLGSESKAILEKHMNKEDNEELRKEIHDIIYGI